MTEPASSRLILLTGATGFIGRPLVTALVDEGCRCLVLSRSPQRAAELLPAGITALAYDDPWPPVQAVIHLAGESVAGWWTAEKRRRIIDSRVDGTRRLVAWMEQVSPRPHTFLSMSAVGIYGHRPGEVLTEASPVDPTHQFRAQVCLAWEGQANRAAALGVRVVTLRLGNVLHPAGGFLGGLLPVYRRTPLLGLGRGGSRFSWISRRDAIRLILFALHSPDLSGPLNLTAPRPVTQAEFTRALAAALGRRVWGRLPNWWFRLVLGDFSQALLDSQDVRPGKALAHGFQFEDTDLETYLVDAFDR